MERHSTCRARLRHAEGLRVPEDQAAVGAAPVSLEAGNVQIFRPIQPLAVESRLIEFQSAKRIVSAYRVQRLGRTGQNVDAAAFELASRFVAPRPDTRRDDDRRIVARARLPDVQSSRQFDLARTAARSLFARRRRAYGS